MRKKAKDTRPAFGAGGLREVEYLGELPGVFGPFVTGKVYRFREGKNPRAVDLRDLPGLAKEAGRDRLRGAEDEKPKRQRRVEERLQAVEEPPVAVEEIQQQQEVEHANE